MNDIALLHSKHWSSNAHAELSSFTVPVSKGLKQLIISEEWLAGCVLVLYCLQLGDQMPLVFLVAAAVNCFEQVVQNRAGLTAVSL